MASSDRTKTLNFNVGVLGHIDSGKTSLAKALSTVASTACFDKNPQSRERGITLDLGFSSFTLPVPDQLERTCFETLQVTLVDCPGHASLIRTIIGGAQIIDFMLLVIDVTKGIQTQTAECLVLGEIACPRMMIVLNKIDLLPPDSRDASINKMRKKLQKTLEQTKFGNVPIVSFAAKPGGADAAEMEALGLQDLLKELNKAVYLPNRSSNGPFIFAVDHCFSIRGQGTVLTGTILSGKVSVNDVIEIPTLKTTKKVKSMQMHHVPVEEAIQGDRVGICVTQFDPKQLERGLVCSPNMLPTFYGGIVSVKRIPYFKGSISTKAKFHVSIGHETVMAKVLFFTLPDRLPLSLDDSFDFSLTYFYLDSLSTDDLSCAQFALLEFERPITSPHACLVIGSKLDADIHLNMCRLAFQGKLLIGLEDKNYDETVLPSLQIYKEKQREGAVERMVNDHEVIGKGLFKKETNIQHFANLKVTFSTGETGVIESGFGQSGKIKIRIPDGLKETTRQLLEATKKKGKGNKDAVVAPTNDVVKIMLSFKKFIYDRQKKISQI